jgi:CubicO group peptidase (beta-lactamase class C family)
MKQFIQVIVLLAYLSGAAVALGKSSDSTTAAKIDTLVRAQADLDMFSGTVLVAKYGKIVYAGAFGQADRDYGILNGMDTRYNIGSIGKTVTAVAVFQLIQNGKLQLSDPLEKFFPECPFTEKHTITIEHLLTHSSGLGDYLEHKDYIAKISTMRSVTDALPLVWDQKPLFEPGERYQYSNSGMLLLGGVIEKISGQSYPEYIRKNIFEPCGMTSSGIVQEDEVLPDRAIGYTQNVDGSFTSNILTVPAASPAGGLRTTAPDLLKFDQALNGDFLLSEESKKIMYKPSRLRPEIACGWEVKEKYGQHYVGHSGGTDGVEAYFYRFIDSGYTIIVLSNYTNGAEELTSDIMALLFDQPYSLPTKVDANFRLGYRMQGEGKLEDAAKVFARNLSTNPPHLLSLFFAANVRIRGGFELEKAITYLDQFQQLAGKDDFPPPVIVWEQKGNAYLKLGKIDEAIQSYKRALELNPANNQLLEKLQKLESK